MNDGSKKWFNAWIEKLADQDTLICASEDHVQIEIWGDGKCLFWVTEPWQSAGICDLP